MAVRIRQIGGLGGDEWNLTYGLARSWRNSPRRDLGDSIMLLDGYSLGFGVPSGSGGGGPVTVVPGAPTAEGGPRPRCPVSTVCYKQLEGGAWSRAACGTAGAVSAAEAGVVTRYGPGVCECSGDLLAITGIECVTREEYLRRSVRETPAPPVPPAYAGPWVEIGIFKFHPEGGYVRDHRAAFLATAREWLYVELIKQKPKLDSLPSIFRALVQREINEWKRDWRLIPELRRIFPAKIDDDDWYPSKALVTGRVPIAKVDHPTSGKAWGLYFSADMDGSTLEFKKVPEHRSWLGRFWDGLKKFVGKIVGALKDALEWVLDKVCDIAKSPIGALAMQAGAMAAGAPPQVTAQALEIGKSMCEGKCSKANDLIGQVAANIKVKAPITDKMKNDLFLSGMSYEQIQKLDATQNALVSPESMAFLAKTAVGRLCKDAGNGNDAPPEEEKPSGVGVKVAIGIGAAGLLYLLFR